MCAPLNFFNMVAIRTEAYIAAVAILQHDAVSLFVEIDHFIVTQKAAGNKLKMPAAARESKNFVKRSNII